MTFDQTKCAIGDLARPVALIGMIVAIITALCLRSDVGVIGTLVAGLTAMYGAKAAESAVVGHAQAMASGGTQP